MSTLHPFGSWLRQCREDADLTRAELAAQVGCTPNTLYKVEAGLRRPSKVLLQRLFDVLHVTDEAYPAIFRQGRERIAPVASSRIRPLSHPMHKAPQPLTACVGRMHDLAAIIARLAVSTTRLLTLVGAPGVGKTRLSIEVAHAASPLFPDGVVFVPLADISDPHQVIDAIHRAVQSISGGDPKSPRTLSDLVGAKQMLIILDTFEHLIAAAPHITALLTTTERCVILATSRQSLQVYGEHLYPLDPLPVPAVTVAESVEPLMAFPAIQLFTERVQAYSPAWQLNSENAPTVVKLCQSMDGLPLGIEILASLTKGHSLRWILDQGQPYLLQARSVWQDRTLRQQSLHGALTWSWGLLTPAEQEVFCLFGHFAEPCSLRSMAAFSRGMGGPWPNLESLVESLVEKHLVLRWTQESGHPVYMMLSTLRVYAQLRGLEHNQAIWSPRSVEEAGCDQHTAHRHRMSSQRVLVTSAMASPARSE